MRGQVRADSWNGTAPEPPYDQRGECSVRGGDGTQREDGCYPCQWDRAYRGLQDVVGGSGRGWDWRHGEHCEANRTRETNLLAERHGGLQSAAKWLLAGRVRRHLRTSLGC